MEKKLYTLCKEMNRTIGDPASVKERADRYMDILLSLIIKIDNGEIHSLIAPGTIIVGDDNIWIEENPDIGVLYSSPEAIFKGIEYDSDAQLFSLGMIIYFMLYSVDFYTSAGLKALEIEAIKRKYPESLIEPEENGNGIVPAEYYNHLKEVMKHLTSWDREKRDVGKKLLIRMYSWIDSVNKVSFMDGDRRIAIVNFKSRDDVKGFPQKNDDLNIRGTKYRIVEKIDIPYRPGSHEYRIRVSKEE